MLLKAEYYDEQITRQNKPVAQLKDNPDFIAYQEQISKLYKLGYREMPIEMRNKVIAAVMNDTTYAAISKDQTYTPFPSKKEYDRAFSFSHGEFEEVNTWKAKEQYFNTVYDTKLGKIINFIEVKDTYNKYDIDPVVFAMNVDPLTNMYPWQSPYAYIRNNPIFFIDIEGMGDPLGVMKIRENRASNLQGYVRTPSTGPNAGVANSKVHQGFDLYAKIGTPITAVKDAEVFRIVADEKADYGKQIILKITNDKGEITYAQYAHLSEINVKEGQEIKENQEIGKTGITGNADPSSPHLHFEYRDKPSPGKGLGGRLNPNEVLDTKFYSQDKNVNQGTTGVIKVDKEGNKTKMDIGGKETLIKEDNTK